ncbi:c-type cytochrome [Hydrogenophaga sp. PBL-H3]|uniref:c-type cytochrome n=1 Tax=Hydrogenophaga sp. PBL-H3 TaxID=434010 RepID=UPI00131F72E4|nr:cytochrome c [Hydrogenophaga sp. PBL-H3]QHE78042.1 c-type cytochrome [Hydrogenophaga sp. PBL-H3]QHE82467.1 c-type cytochrome [Hydrogenophaga sp. PBL-H3]
MSAPPLRRRGSGAVVALVLLALLLCAGAWLLWPSRPVAVQPASPTTRLDDAATIERGRYLALLGNCMGCHTARGGAAFAGGRGIATPFGTAYSSNLTPDSTGLKDWSADDFWRALHHGQSRDGRLLNPAFPYTNTTYVTRPDSDALFAFFSSLAPVQATAPPNDLGRYLDSQAALKAWRTLYFRPGEAMAPVADNGAAVNELQRGAYLVNGLAHCSACHVPRNALGGSSDMLSLAGGLMAAQGWYAPSLLDPADGGVQEREVADIVALFQTGRSGGHIVTGPMAEVVQHSTQHWEIGDLQAMAVYLKALPATRSRVLPKTEARSDTALARGGKLYEQQCAQCHGAQGQGIRGSDGAWAYPALAGNSTVLQGVPANLVQAVLYGGFGPSTAGHPRPFGMPPFVLDLSGEDVADLLTYVRSAWGHDAPPVSALDVQQLRSAAAR